MTEEPKKRKCDFVMLACLAFEALVLFVLINIMCVATDRRAAAEVVLEGTNSASQ